MGDEFTLWEMNLHKPNGFFSDPFIYISQNILYLSDLFTYIMIVKLYDK